MQVLDGVYESGITHWDTADAYLDSEHLIGEWYVCPQALPGCAYERF